jgi:uncharacterized secreted protein with C-terminal beta-propeller domain
MVQKEVAQKTKRYGLVGILLAVLLVSMIYSYGVSPSNLPLPSPNTSPSANTELQMKTFSSYDELRNFLSASNTNNGDTYFSARSEGAAGQAALAPTLPVPSPTSTSEAGNTKDWSTTNIQVEGVDEADIVKTDGEYLYFIGKNNQVVYVLDTNPQNPKILSKIILTSSYLSGIYLSEDGKKLAVIGESIYPIFCG